ncbi:PhoD-like phosphatase N-terminal domain-containing protein [Rugamonas rubra]|uniref:PhoD-like phosphatase, N-terminal domain n=1 Tax=Rugamonas rubra TaxID=758825 RepID=A0A1I4UQ38_9BURK|nr:PhoD-like phosphatase N-terminal domain-containing protein [Rugamonas rubra]SFM91051.1 PhoD-like phosphatase, N-terminal domain [Rugamonas rubra]
MDLTSSTPSHADPEIAVRWQMATDPAMQLLVASGATATTARQDFTVKIDADGPLPGHVYYYQFAVDGAKSPVGRTWRFVDTVLSRKFSAATERSLRTLAGPGNRNIVECGA